MSASRSADSVRLASYLSLGVTGTMMATAHSEAAVVAIDLTNLYGLNITGVNAGLSSGGIHSINSWLGVGTGRLELYNNFNYNGYRYWGLDGDDGLAFAVVGSGRTSPRNFGAGALIDYAGSDFSQSAYATAFRYQYGGANDVSPDFGASSFMGFRFGAGGNYNYGYLEVTWTSATNTFQILSGAYESTVNTGILAGATAAAIPLPAASLLALMALGGNSFRRSRARAA